MVNNLLDNFDIDVDIWKLHPQLKVLFAKEYNDGVSSKIMWALLLDTHPKSVLADLGPTDRRAIIAQDYLSNETFDWKMYNDTIEKMKKYLLTRPERLLKNWENKLEERDIFISATPYNAETIDMLEKTMKETWKMWENYEKVLAAFKKQEDESTLGGAQESLSELGLL